jgi:hypothetical protein
MSVFKNRPNWPRRMMLLAVCAVVSGLTNAADVTPSASKNGEIDPSSGFIIKPGFEMVRAHCTACHSAKLVTQNHMSRERWLSTIRWMQKTQNLWPLPQEEEILDYLSANYGERSMGRRAPLPEHLMPKKVK